MDSLGACLGIAKLAKFCGVQPYIVADTSDHNTARYFEKLGSMKGYEDVVIDSSQALEINSSGSLLVVVDVNNRKFFESPDLFATVQKAVVIDHHIKVDEYETAFSYIEPSASSTCEIVSELLEQVLPDGDLTKDEAEILLAGMLLDTKQFTRNTGSRTFGAAQYLRNQGAVPVEAQELYQTSFNEFERETRFQSKLKMYRGQLVIAVNDYEDNELGDRVIGAKVADRMLELQNVMASFAVCKIGEVVYVSARSAGKINVQQIMCGRLTHTPTSSERFTGIIGKTKNFRFLNHNIF
jgi:c-di-AMP phosphodiesterase-like protein